MINLKINLRQLKHAMMTTPKGAKCIVLPIAENQFYVGKDEKAIYLDVVGFDYTPKNADDKNTHLLKQSFSKEHLASLPEDAKRQLPILGNAKVSGGGGQREEPEPNTMGEIPAAAVDLDSLPF